VVTVGSMPGIFCSRFLLSSRNVVSKISDKESSLSRQTQRGKCLGNGASKDLCNRLEREIVEACRMHNIDGCD
jgi:hypothetical protein